VIDGFDMAAFVSATLAEDMGAGGDITSAAVIPAEARLAAVMDSRDPVVVAGLPLAAAFFRALDPACTITMLASDGDAVPAGADLMRIEGNARALLTAIGRARAAVGGVGLAKGAVLRGARPPRGPEARDRRARPRSSPCA
jgi:nicotinate-nucleotide pyrophosphorylase (carboxylating)